MKQLATSSLFFSIIALSLIGCSKEMPQEMPSITAPESYKEGIAWKRALPQENEKQSEWWQMYHDVELSALMQELNSANLSIAKYEATYKQALAVMESSQASLWPSLSVAPSVTRSQTASSSTKRSTDYKVPLQASWSPDLWGDIQHLVNAYQLSADASLNDLQAAKLSAQVLLAQSYFQLRSIDIQEALLQRTIDAYTKTLTITQNQYNAGIVTKKDVISAQAQLKSVEAQKIELRIQRQQLEHSMATLVGKLPSEFSIAKTIKPIVIPEIPYVLPSSLLERRSDVAAAERRMKQANIQVGIAQDAWFPTFNLTASAGYTNNKLSSLISSSNLIWAVGGSITQNIFDGGLREANLKQAKGVYEANVASYKLSVLTAFQQVEDALLSVQTLKEEIAVQEEAVALAERALALTLEQYQQGIINYTSVIVAQTSLLSNQVTLNTLQNRYVVATVSLISAVGGDLH